MEAIIRELANNLPTEKDIKALSGSIAIITLLSSVLDDINQNAALFQDKKLRGFIASAKLNIDAAKTKMLKGNIEKVDISQKKDYAEDSIHLIELFSLWINESEIVGNIITHNETKYHLESFIAGRNSVKN